MAIPGSKPKAKGELLRNCLDFLFGFENRRGEVLDSWILYADNFSFSPEEFYALLDNEMVARRIPSMAVTRLSFNEGGLLSDKRTYMRLFRERLALYFCAAPFGTGFYFSFRAVYVPALVRLWHILALLIFLNVVCGLLFILLGFVYAMVALATLPFAVAAAFRNATAASIADLDTLLLKIPVISTVYENWFREDTFYRIDTRSLYLTQLPQIIRHVAEEVTAAKGAKLLPEDESPPVLRELYRRELGSARP